MFKNCSHTVLIKLRIAIERCSNSTDTEQAVPAKHILAAIRETVGEASADKGNALFAAPVTTISAAPPAPPPLLYANQHALVSSAPAPAALAKKPHSAKKTYDDKRPTTPSVQTSSHASAALPSITNVKAKSDEKSSGTVLRVGDKANPVFISYQSAFTESALKIKHAVEARGIPCWIAAENLVGDVQDAIGKALMVAPVIIICYSHSYRESQ